MNEQELITKLQTNKFWSKEYNNFQAITPEAIEYLRELGYVIATYDNSNGWKIKGILENKILTGFTKNEPDYKKYHNDWEAKEAMPYYSPELSDLLTLEQEIEGKKLKVQKDEYNKIYWEIDNAKRIAKYEEEYHNPIRLQKELEELKNKPSQIKSINGRKYHAEYWGIKYQTIEEATNKENAEKQERIMRTQKQLSETKDKIKTAKELIAKYPNYKYE